jgi:hypothetical protein
MGPPGKPPSIFRCGLTSKLLGCLCSKGPSTPESKPPPPSSTSQIRNFAATRRPGSQSTRSQCHPSASRRSAPTTTKDPRVPAQTRNSPRPGSSCKSHHPLARLQCNLTARAGEGTSRSRYAATAVAGTWSGCESRERPPVRFDHGCRSDPDHTELDCGHGRIIRRSIWVTDAGSLDFPHVTQIARIRRDGYDLDGTMTSKEIVHAVTLPIPWFTRQRVTPPRRGRAVVAGFQGNVGL